MYDTNAVNAVTRAMRSEVSDHVTACEKNSLRELLDINLAVCLAGCLDVTPLKGLFYAVPPCAEVIFPYIFCEFSQN